MVDLSVALITFNSENYIKETLNSILKQNCSYRFEVVIGDDFSTDATFEIIKSYQLKHPEIFKIKQNTIQLGILRNFKETIERCVGNYILNFDGDDIVKSEFAFQKLVNILKNNENLGFVDSGYDIYFEAYNKTKIYANKQIMKLSKNDYTDYAFLGKIIPIGACFNREKLFKYVDFDTYINKGINVEDYPTLVDMTANCEFAKIDESLFTYRIHQKSYSFNSEFEKSLSLKQEVYSLFNYFNLKYKFNKNLSYQFNQNHYKFILHLAGSYEKKKLGKEMFQKIESKNIFDYINYLSSQYRFIRYLARIRKTKNIIWYKVNLIFDYPKKTNNLKNH